MTFPFPDVVRQSFTYRDARGWTSTFRFYVNLNGGDANAGHDAAGPVLAAFDALTNAALQGAIGALGEVGVLQYGAHPAEYQSVVQKAVLTYQDVAGGLHRFAVPAPIVALFLADQVTVDPSNTHLVALNTAIVNASVPSSGTAFVCTRTGENFVNYIGGIWQGKKLRRRTSITTLVPALTASEPGE